MNFIPVYEPELPAAAAQAAAECVRSGWISSEGPAVRMFEERFAERIGRRHAVAVSSGTAALDIAVAALGIGPGDDVILPAFTIISCAAAVVRAGARPMLADADPATWNMDVGQAADRIGPRTRAIMPVHIYGLPVEMGPLRELAQPRGVRLIEDAAEALGLTYRGRPCGAWGDVATFSFYPNKPITTGEGGMVVTDDDGVAERCRSLRNLCFEPERRFVHRALGWNYRLTALQAALGLAQLENLGDIVARKRRLAAGYEERLADVPWLQRPMPRTDDAENGYWVYGVALADDVPFDAAEAMRRLHRRGVGTRPFFWPMHEQPVFQARGWFVGERYPVAERLARRGFYLPGGLTLTEAQQDRVAEAVRELFT